MYVFSALRNMYVLQALVSFFHVLESTNYTHLHFFPGKENLFESSIRSRKTPFMYNGDTINTLSY